MLFIDLHAPKSFNRQEIAYPRGISDAEERSNPPTPSRIPMLLLQAERVGKLSTRLQLA